MIASRYFPPSRAAAEFRGQPGVESLLRLDLHRAESNQRFSPVELWHLRLAQRLLHIDSDETIADAMVGHGLHSAHHITLIPEHTFVRKYLGSFGNDTERARTYHRRAMSIKARSQHAFFNIKSLVAEPHFRGTMGHNTSTALVNLVATAPGYQTLFGSLDYLSAPDRCSMTDPAAYMADLLRITDQYIGANNSIANVYALATRRPDLFTTALTPQNTNTPQPTLQIVNAVLDTAISTYAAIAAASAKPPAILSTLTPLQQCAVSMFPVGLPFNAPLAQIRANLGSLGTSLAEVYGALQQDPALIGAESLGLSLEKAAIIATAHTDPDTLNPLYGYPSTLTTAALVTQLQPVTAFLAATGLSKFELDALLVQGLSAAEVTAEVANSFFINSTGEKSLPPMAVQSNTTDPHNIYEEIANLSVSRLDRMARFIRLARAIKWSFADLDWALTSAGGKLDADAISSVATMQSMISRTQLPLNAIVALSGDLKIIGKVSDTAPQDFFDVVFNNGAPASGLGSGAQLVFNPATTLPWTVLATDSQNATIRGRLAGALGVSGDDLSRLAAAVLSQPLAQESVLQLDLQVLSQLYALATSAKASGLAIPEYLLLCTLVASLSLQPQQLLATASWVASLSCTIYDLAYVIDAKYLTSYVDIGYDPSPDTLKSNLLTLLTATAATGSAHRISSQSFVLAPTIDATLGQTIFSALQTQGVLTVGGIVTDTKPAPAVTAKIFELTAKTFEDGHLVNAANAQYAFGTLQTNGLLISTSPGTAFLSETYTAGMSLSMLEFPSTPPDKALLQAAVGIVLDCVRVAIDNTRQVIHSARSAQGAVVSQGLAQLLGGDKSLLEQLLQPAAQIANYPNVLAGFLTPPAPDADMTTLAAVVRTLSQMQVAGRALQLATADLVTICKCPAAFNIADLTHLTMLDLQSAASYRKLISLFGTQAPALRTLLVSPNGAGDRSAKLTALVSLTGWDPTQLSAFVTAFWPSEQTYGTVAGIVILSDCFALAHKTGLGASGLLTLSALSQASLSSIESAPSTGKFDADNWDVHLAAAAMTENAVSAVLAGGSQGRPSALAATRDALVESALTLVGTVVPAVASADDLSRLLLLDLQIGEQDRNSVISQGILSLQLYLQRCRLNQEPGVASVLIPDEWWEWLSTYPLWQANRTVFLFPESYIDPSLRPGASETFTQMQQALLQNQVTDDQVLAALSGYLQSLEELGQLRIVATYRYVVPDAPGATTGTDTLFFFARTVTSPYQYYFRTATDVLINPATESMTATWAPWRKVDATVPSAYVTPVYAFGKLFIFWVEQTSAQGTQIQGGNQSASVQTSASIRFSFISNQGHWCPPQTLQSGILVTVAPDDYLKKLDGGLLDPGSYDPTTPNWQRVYVLTVTDASGAEKLIVAYGYGVEYTSDFALPDGPSDQQNPPSADTDAYNHRIYETACLVNVLAKTTTGYAFHVPPTILSNQLLMQRLDDRVAFTRQNPTDKSGNEPVFPAPAFGPDSSIVIMNYTSIVDPDFYSDAIFGGNQDRAAVKTSGGKVGSLAAQQYEPLLAQIGRSNISLLSVKNDPASFVFDNGDDVFLGVAAPSPDLLITQLAKVLSEEVIPTNQKDSMPVYIVYPGSGPYRKAPDPNALSYAFVRLGTNSIPQLNCILMMGGTDALFTLAAQQTAELSFTRFYPANKRPARIIAIPSDTIDFGSAQGPYFWELFFHAPFLIAMQLNASQQYEQAKRWLEYIFSPTAPPEATPPPMPNDRYWRFLPFRDKTWSSLVQLLSDSAAIAAYNNDPFDPHAIAAVRSSAYPQAIVMRYVANLLDWGDLLFTENTRESINQASNIYLFAADLLGPQPEAVGEAATRSPLSYADLVKLYNVTGTPRAVAESSIQLDSRASQLDNYYAGCTITLGSGTTVIGSATIVSYVGATATATVAPPFSRLAGAPYTYTITSIPQFLIDLETLIPGQSGFAAPPIQDVNTYFTLPQNSDFLGYWSRLQDRQFKIRNSLTITGAAQVLPLFSPALDVRNLVRAAASGANVFAVAQSAQSQLLPFRYSVVVQRARTLAATVSELGSALLAAFEKTDVEALATLQLTQAAALLNLQTQMKQDAITQATQTAASLQQSLTAAVDRQNHYATLAKKDLSPGEQQALDAMLAAMLLNSAGNILKVASAIAYTIPETGSPFAITYGGIQIGSSLAAAGAAFDLAGAVSTYVSESSSQNAAYDRRKADWQFQANQAECDIKNIQSQLAANDLQTRILRQDLAAHQLSIEQSEALQTFYARKFTSTQLYQWMASRLATVYFQTYSLAFDLAQRAQLAFQYQFDTNASFINFGYWDNIYRGLCAGEALQLSIEQMDAASLLAASRRLEIRKTISLLQLNPQALYTLRESGVCSFALRQQHFDQDYPGHYARKIKSISISLPALVGPYQEIKATLQQNTNSIVLSTNPAASLYLLGVTTGLTSAPGPNDLRTNWCTNQQIAISHGVSDSGLFVLNFDDERYLPFEGTGAVSTWTLSMPKAANAIDYSTISDVIVTVEYTALDGGSTLRAAVINTPAVSAYDGAAVFALAQQCSDAWYTFMADHSSTVTQTLNFAMPASIPPPNISGVLVTGLYFRLDVDMEPSLGKPSGFLSITPPWNGGTAIAVTLDDSNGFACNPPSAVPLGKVAGSWMVQFTLAGTPTTLLDANNFLDRSRLRNIAVIVNLSGARNWTA